MPGVHVNHPLDGGGESIAAMIFKDRGDESNGKEEGGGGGGATIQRTRTHGMLVLVSSPLSTALSPCD